jgi:CHASE2 domain-containing sensor protein
MLHPFLAVFLSLLLHLYLYNSEYIVQLDHKFYDNITRLSEKLNPQEDGSYTVIIDIDEQSLQQLGQWPWPRVIDAQLINMIQEMHPSAIGINILFPEKDRVSPLFIEKFYKDLFNIDLSFTQLPQALKDNDKLLYGAIQQSNSTLSTYFKNGVYTAPHCKKLSYHHNLFKNTKVDFQANSLLCNHPSIQKGIENFGFINAEIDKDGTFRRIPLFMRYREQVFPSFALATLLSFDKNIKLNPKQTNMLVNFSGKNPKTFSAVEVLNGNVPSHEIQGKIVIVGSSVIGLNPTYTTGNNKKISNSMIHAFVIENILHNLFLSQPKEYKQLNTFLSFLFSTLIIIFFFRKLYLQIAIILVISLVLSFLLSIEAYNHNIYISLGYFWIPFLYSFSIVFAYHLKILNTEKHQQETLLIKQSKLASMGEMITLIAHQWRQPLSIINGIVLNMDIDQRKKILDAKKLDEHLMKIEETTAYLSKTINDFTDFFSTNKQSEHFYIKDIITQAKQLIPASNQKDLKIIYKQQENINIIGYKSELLQSLLIILNNAIYVCKKNLHNTKQGKIIIHAYMIKGNLQLSIEDNGGGVDSKNLKKIFNPYFTTKDKTHGTGLGLYILKLIVEDSMNGKVFVHNGKEGAVFNIEIPSKPIHTKNKK